MFTSVNGVRALLGRLWELGQDVRALSHLKLACIGPSTAAVLAEYHLRADIVPDEYRAEALVEALKHDIVGKRVLLARASRGRDVIPSELNAAGADVRELVVYRNEDVESLPAAAMAAIEAGEVDWIGLSSPSIARQLASLLSGDVQSMLGTKTRLVAISPVTQQAAEEAGLPVNVTAAQYTWDGIFDAILQAESD